MEKIVLVLTTLPEDFDAASVARALVDARHAACVSVLPVQASTYRWQAVIETAREHQLVIKTTEGRVDDVRQTLRGLHPYTLPEFLVVPAEGDDAYAEWVRGSVGP